MRASSNDIYVNGEYFMNNPTWNLEDSSWKADVIFGLMTKNSLRPHQIIEVGCGAGGILKHLAAKDEHIESLRGYDISTQAIELARKYQSDRLQYFNEDITANDSIHSDLMLVIDVIEHIDDFYGFLRNLKPRSTHFIFHIPLDLCCRSILKPHILLQQRNAVGHIHYFSKEMAIWLLHDSGYEIIDWVYTKPIVDTNPPDSFKRRVKKVLRNFSFNLNKDLSAKLWGGYSMMLLVK